MNNNLGNKSTMAKNIRYYMDMFGLKRNDICDALGFKYSTFADWVNGKKYPRIDKIEIMANYFGINKSDLVEEHSEITDKKEGPNAAPLGDMESELLAKFSALPETAKQHVLKYLDLLAGETPDIWVDPLSAEKREILRSHSGETFEDQSEDSHRDVG